MMMIIIILLLHCSDWQQRENFNSQPYTKHNNRHIS